MVSDGIATVSVWYWYRIDTASAQCQYGIKRYQYRINIVLEWYQVSVKMHYVIQNILLQFVWKTAASTQLNYVSVILSLMNEMTFCTLIVIVLQVLEFLSTKELSSSAANSLKIILEDLPDVLSSKQSCNIRIMYKQRVYVTLFPKLHALFKSVNPGQQSTSSCHGLILAGSRQYSIPAFQYKPVLEIG